MNFIYTINPESDEPEMVIDKSIGLDENGCGIDGSQWARELMMLDSMGKKRVKVYINSQGGLVTDGYSICSAILHTKCRVDTYCRGIAASIAGVIFMCGRQRWMADYGILMFHNPFGGKNEEALEYMKNSLATLIAVRADLKVETVLAIMARTTFLDASEAIDLQLVTDIETSSGSNVGRLAPIKVKNESDEFAYEFWKESQSIFNSMVIMPDNKSKNSQPKIDTKMDNEFKEINNKLDLMDEASQSSRIKAIDRILNSAKETEDKAAKAVKDMEDTMAKMKADMDETSKKNKEAYDALETEYVKMKAEKDAFEKEEKVKNELRVKNEAKDMIASAVKLGKIKNDADVIAKWTAKFESDPEGIKDILDTMGVTAQAPDFSGVTDPSKEQRVSGMIGTPQSPEKNAEYMNKLIAEKQKQFQEEAKKKRNS